MFIELVDLLRCPRDHEDSWLVAAIYERSDRDITAGILGCPICGAEYPIENGVAVFGDRAPIAAEAVRGAYDESDDDAAMRCAAMLDLFDPGGAVVLGGAWGRVARALLDITPVSILLVDPPAGVAIGTGLSAIRIRDRLPIACGSLRGVALDEATATLALLESAVRALRPHGRIVAPISAAVPPDVIERARDDRFWVGEMTATPTSSGPVTLQRARLR